MSDLHLKPSPSAKHRIGIKWKMYVILVIFIGIVVGVIWFFQVQMMNYFYQISKFNELEISAQALSSSLQNPSNLQPTAEKYASEYNADIWIYRISSDGSAILITEAQGTVEEEISLKTKKFSQLYDRASLNGGLYIALVSQENFYNGHDLQILRDNQNDPSSYPIELHHASQISAVYVGLREVHDTQYMIVQSTTLTPVQAMVKTLQNQALWIGLILSLLALIMAGLMSKLITKPIVKMNDAAKRLAQGQYDVNFSVQGYREIDELSDTLNYASHELAKTDKLQKELISNISHDLRTPLTMIKGYSEVMRDIPGENTPENIQIIIDETARLSDLVNDMLDLSKIQAGTRQPNFQVFSLTDTVRDVLIRYERLTMQQGYQIEFSAEDEVQVFADRGMILQVIYNLINNAINYTGTDLSVLVKQETHDGVVRISVLDTGDGISEQDIPMIWDRYYKVDKVHRRATVGTGLGLSIVKGILELHHASYGVQSTSGHGSTFWFELNAVSPAPVKENDYNDYIEATYETQETEQTQ